MTYAHELPLFALDFETTGLSPLSDRVIEIGLTGPRPFHAVVSDAPPSSPGAQACHGITEIELMQRGMPEQEALHGLIDALGEGPVRIVCHNAPFEKAFLERWTARLGQQLPPIQWICTLELAKILAPSPSLPKSLEQVAWLLGLDHGTLHRAPGDAELTLRAYEALLAWAQVKSALANQDLLVYLAGPLRGDGSPGQIQHNQERVLRQARWAQAVLPDATLVVPHGNFAFLDEGQDKSGEIRRLALRGCERLLGRCEAMILCGRELSPGMAQEKCLADRLAIPSLQVPGWDRPLGAEARAEGAA